MKSWFSRRNHVGKGFYSITTARIFLVAAILVPACWPSILSRLIQPDGSDTPAEKTSAADAHPAGRPAAEGASLVHSGLIGSLPKNGELPDDTTALLANLNEPPEARRFSQLVAEVLRRQENGRTHRRPLRMAWQWTVKSRRGLLHAGGERRAPSVSLEAPYFDLLASLQPEENDNPDSAAARVLADLQRYLVDHWAQQDSPLVPVSVNDGLVRQPSDLLSGNSAGVLPAGASTAGGPAVSPDWFGLPAGNTAPVASSSGPSRNVAPSWGASLPPVWDRGTPWRVSAGAETISFAPNHGGGSISLTIPVASPLAVSANLPTSLILAAPTAPAAPSQTTGKGGSLLASSSAVFNTGVSGAPLSTGSTRFTTKTFVSSLLTAPVGGSGSGTLTPAIPPGITLVVANGEGPGGNGFVGEYSGSTGAAVSGFTSPSAGINQPFGVCIGYPTVSGGVLPTFYLTDQAAGTVGAYSVATGAAISGFTQITGLNTPGQDTLTGNFLWVASYADDSNATVRQYNATTGAYNNVQITSVVGAYGVTAVGNVIYVMSADNNTPIKAFNATTGAALTLTSPTFENPNTIFSNGNGILYVATYTPDQVFAYTTNNNTLTALAGFNTISLPGTPGGMTNINGDLYTVDQDNNTIEEWNALTGASIAYTSPGNLDGPGFVAAIPEPGSVGLLAFGATVIFGRRRRARGGTV